MANPKYEAVAFSKGWPSVTTITGMKDKPFLAFWRGKIGNEEATRITKEAQSVGFEFESYVDNWFEDADATQGGKHEQVIARSEEATKYYYQAVRNWHTFAEAFKPTPVKKQEIVYSLTYKYIGTYDRLFRVDDKLILGDWKATNQISDEYFLQLEAYYRAALEMDPAFYGDIKELWLCQFPKKEDIKLNKHITKFKPDEERFRRGFLTLLDHWWWDKNKSKPSL